MSFIGRFLRYNGLRLSGTVMGPPVVNSTVPLRAPPTRTLGCFNALDSFAGKCSPIQRHFTTVSSSSSIASDQPVIEKATRTGVARKLKTKEPDIGIGVPLTTGHSIKKRYEKETKVRENIGFMEVSAYGIAQQIDLKALRLEFEKDNGYRCATLPVDLDKEVLLVSAKLTPGSGVASREAFIFRNGSIVFWNMPESEHRLFLNRVRRFCREILPPPLVEREDLQYHFTDSSTRLVGEDIFLQTHESRQRSNQTRIQPDDKTLSQGSDAQPWDAPSLRYTKQQERNEEPADDGMKPVDNQTRLIPIEDPVRMEQFAFSDALSLSVKLSLLENRFDAVAVQMEPWMEEMKRGVRGSFNQSSVLKKTGELFTLRHLLNVSTSMIETPDFYWDRPEIEGLHHQLRGVLSISSRTRVLNSRLNMCCELTQILSNHLQSRHASHLEWMIIVLILVEVCFEASHYHHNQRERERAEQTAAAISR